MKRKVKFSAETARTQKKKRKEKKILIKSGI